MSETSAVSRDNFSVLLLLFLFMTLDGLSQEKGTVTDCPLKLNKWDILITNRNDPVHQQNFEVRVRIQICLCQLLC